MSFWTSIRTAASALTAQHLRLDIISNNIANVETTRTAEGGPYKRQDVIFEPENTSSFSSHLNRASSRHDHSIRSLQGGVRVTEITTDTEAGQRVYDPNHPDSDEEGYVTYPNVNLVVEMTNMVSATRSYEANLAVVDAAKNMASKALDIGR